MSWFKLTEDRKIPEDLVIYHAPKLQQEIDTFFIDNVEKIICIFTDEQSINILFEGGDGTLKWYYVREIENNNYYHQFIRLLFNIREYNDNTWVPVIGLSSPRHFIEEHIKKEEKEEEEEEEEEKEKKNEKEDSLTPVEKYMILKVITDRYVYFGK